MLTRCCIKEEAFYFPLGLGLLLMASYACFVFSTGIMVLAILWCAFLVLAAFEIRFLLKNVSLKLLGAAPFLLLGFWSCLTPATFFDSLVYHIGLPHQYLALGRMRILPYHLYSSFPPFDQVLNLLFAGIQAETGIKIFSIIILFAILYCSASYIQSLHADSEFRAAQFVVPILAIPSFWILVHLVTADLLTALFFSSGVFLILINGERSSVLVIAATLVAFSCWTKWNVLLYAPFLILFFGVQIRRTALFTLVTLLLLLPLLIRNYVRLGDPLYPILSVKLSSPLWGIEQENALHGDSFPARAISFGDVVAAPVKLITTPDDFGSASEIGLVPLFALLLYPFAAQKQMRTLLIYIGVCFYAWLFAFPNFRQFFPVFVLLTPMFYFSWNYLAKRSAALNVAAVIFCGLTGLYLLLPFYRDLFPPISWKENCDQYLRANVTYYPIARFLNEGQAILVGETRSAYFRVPLVVPTAYDRNTFIELLKVHADAGSFYQTLKELKVTHIVYNRPQFQRLSEKYGLWKISAEQQQVLQQFVRQYTVPKLRANGIYLLELK